MCVLQIRSSQNKHRITLIKAKLAATTTNKQNIRKEILDFKGKEIVTRKMVKSNARLLKEFSKSE